MCLDSELREKLETRVMEKKEGSDRWEVFKALTDNRQSKKQPFYFEEVSLRSFDADTSRYLHWVVFRILNTSECTKLASECVKLLAQFS